MKPNELIIALFLWVCSLIVFAQKPELVIPVGHTDVVTSVSFSPDGKYIVSSSRDGSVKIWQVESASLIRTMEGHSSYVNGSRFSPDGKSVLSWSSNEIKIRDARIGSQLVNINQSGIRDADYSPDGASIVCALKDGNFKILDSKTGNVMKTLYQNKGAASMARISPNGNFVLGCSDLNSIGIWNFKTTKMSALVDAHKAKGHFAKYSPDGKRIITALNDSIVVVLDSNNGKIIKSIKVLSFSNIDFVADAAYSPDGKTIRTLEKNGTLKIWDGSGDKILVTIIIKPNSGTWPMPLATNFSDDGKYLITSTGDSNALLLWNAGDGKLIRSFRGNAEYIHSASFNIKGDRIITGSADNSGKIWNAENGKLLFNLKGHTNDIYHVKFSPDGQHALTVSLDTTVKIWSAETGKLKSNIKGHHAWIVSADFSQNGKYVAAFSRQNISYVKSHLIPSDSNKTLVWEIQSNRLLASIQGIKPVFNPTANTILTINKNNFNVNDFQTGRLIKSVKADKESIEFVEYSPDGKRILAGSSYYDTLKIWDANTYTVLSTLLMGPKISIGSAIYSPDMNYILTTSRYSNRVKIWNAQNVTLINTLEDLPNSDTKASYSPDSKFILTDSHTRMPYGSVEGSLTRNLNSVISIWDSQSGNLTTTTHVNGTLYDVDWERKKIIVNKNSRLSILDLYSGNELLSWIVIDSADWVVTHPSGLFDASASAMNKLYFVSGFDKIDFNQLKTRYYEPGLWKKVMSGEKLRNVVGFNEVELPPDIQVGHVDDKGNLPIEVMNRGGGIGEITLYINGKEAIKDIRKPGTDAKSPTLTFSIPISTYKSLIPGTQNFLAVKAWNAGHWIESRGTLVEYVPPTKSEINPSVYILVCGVSDYTGNEIDLKYAAKDAEDIAKALELGAKRLFGVDRSYIYTLTTNQKPNSYPTKTNIVKTFEKISTTASSADVIVVYLSGHGINIGGTDGDFHYLTQEAYTASASAYDDPAIKQQSTVSSQELVELFKKVPALKQVLMIDACASGKVIDNLMAKKDVESGTLRALDRMKDRTGMHIITGCTADAVSYEASQYGQGVLTYSLLEGIRGAALRDDEFVDISKLFQYAQDRVPTLASGIGGIQTPMVFSPNGSQSFDVGLLTDVEKKEIPISKIRPVYILSNFQDEDEMSDVLGLGKKVDQMLSESAARGVDAPLIFVGVREYPDGCQLVGRYKNLNGKIILKLKVRCGEKNLIVDLSGSDTQDLVTKIINTLKE